MKAIANFSLLFFTFGSTLPIHAAVLNGTIRGESGEPLAGVRVLSYAPVPGTANGSRRMEAMTDRNGRFTLRDHGRVIYFRRDNLRPVSKIVDLSATRVEATIESIERSVWRVPACSTIAGGARRVGMNFKFLVPEEILVRRTPYLGSDMYFFGYETNEQIEVMFNSAEATATEPSEDFLLNSNEFAERAWNSGNTLGHEARGTMRDGKRWRRIAFAGGAIEYRTNSREAASIFDSMIESVCFDEPTR